METNNNPSINYNTLGHYSFIERPNGVIIEYNGQPFGDRFVPHFQFYGDYASETGYRSHFYSAYRNETPDNIDIEYTGFVIAEELYKSVLPFRREQEKQKLKEQQLKLF